MFSSPFPPNLHAPTNITLSISVCLPACLSVSLSLSLSLPLSLFPCLFLSVPFSLSLTLPSLILFLLKSPHHSVPSLFHFFLPILFPSLLLSSLFGDAQLKYMLSNAIFMHSPYLNAAIISVSPITYQPHR